MNTRTRPERTFLINSATLSPILQITSPRSDAGCASAELHFAIDEDNTVKVRLGNRVTSVAIELSELTFYDRSGQVMPRYIGLGAGDPTQGPVVPVEGPDGLLWLCREDDEAQECICIPWFQD